MLNRCLASCLKGPIAGFVYFDLSPTLFCFLSLMNWGGSWNLLRQVLLLLTNDYFLIGIFSMKKWVHPSVTSNQPLFLQVSSTSIMPNAPESKSDRHLKKDEWPTYNLTYQSLLVIFKCQSFVKRSWFFA